jgi:hypothetical protein
VLQVRTIYLLAPLFVICFAAMDCFRYNTASRMNRILGDCKKIWSITGINGTCDADDNSIQVLESHFFI